MIFSKIMVDTNVLVYVTEANAPNHEEFLRVLNELEEAGVSLWISRQILREFIAARSREQVFSRPVPLDVLEAMVDGIQNRFDMAEDGPVVTENLLRILRAAPTGGKQVHDANIVATMLTYGISQLLTNNVKDFDRFQQFITVQSLTIHQNDPR